MKKSNLYVGVATTLLGVFFLVLSVTGYGRLSGFAGGFLGSGLTLAGKYIYWARPRNKERYEEKMARERVALRDERNIALRGKTGYLMYIFTIVALALASSLCFLLGAEVWVIQMLSGLIACELVGGHLAYRYYSKRW